MQIGEYYLIQNPDYKEFVRVCEINEKVIVFAYFMKWDGKIQLVNAELNKKSFFEGLENGTITKSSESDFLAWKARQVLIGVIDVG